MKGFVSIIIPLYNKKDSIGSSVRSVLNQTYDSFEIIIVDDGSSDGSDEIVKSFKDNRIRYIYKSNGGVSSARNRGILESRGEWILFLDADDILYPDALNTLLAPVKESSNIQISCGNFDIIEEGKSKCGSKNSINAVIANNYKSFFYQKFNLRAGNFIVKRHLAKKFPYPESLSRFEDLKVILEYLGQAEIHCTEKIVMAYQKGYSELSRCSSKIEKDFIFNMSFHNKTFWENCNQGKVLYLGWMGYKIHHKKILETYGWNIIWGVIARVLIIMARMGVRL